MRFSITLAAIAVVVFAIGCSKGADTTATDSTTSTGTTGGTATPPASTPTTSTPASTAPTTGTTAAATGGKGYAAVQAIFTNNCMPCHAAGKAKAGVDLSSYDTVMKGGKHGPIIVAGDPAKSSLIDYLNGSKKPQMPMNRPPLSAADIKTITDWIQAGAKNE